MEFYGNNRLCVSVIMALIRYRIGKHTKPVGLLNVDGFYDYFIKWVIGVD